MRSLSPLARRYLYGLWSAAGLVGLVSALLAPPFALGVPAMLATLIFALMLTVVDMTSFEQDDGRTISIAVALLIAGLTALPWQLLLLAIAVGTSAGALARDSAWWQTGSLIAVRWLAFAVGRVVISIFFQGAAFEPGAGSLPYTSLSGLLGLLCCGALVYLIERAAVAGLAAARDGRPLRAALALRRDDMRWYVLVFAPIGGLLATLWQISGWAFVLGIVPMVIVQDAVRKQRELEQTTATVRSLAASSASLSNQLERLQSLVVALITSRDVPTMLSLLCERIAALMGANSSWVVLSDDEGTPQLVATYGLPVPTDGVGPQPVPRPQSYAAVLARQRVMVFTDQHTQTLAPLEALTLGPFWSALVCIPLVEERRVMGAICLAFADLRGLSEDEQRILNAFARQAATVIQNARLFRRLQESQAELVQSSKLAAVGTFAAGIAHEFNNLLAGMLGYAQLGLADDDAATKNESLKVVVDTCKRGKSITGSLLTFARRQEPRRELADLAEAVEGTLTLMELELRKHTIQVVRRISPVPLTICDAGQISQVFLNLLTNARDAMRPAGGTLTVTLAEAAGQIVLAVEDTGSGIPDAIRDQIFEPFVTTKGALGGSTTPGTGLGLAVSYGIVKSHGGEVEVASRVGQGTTMTIRLPIVTDQAPAEAPAAPAAPADLPPLRLLVVDDDLTVGRSLAGLLEQAGHQVTLCTDGAAALAAYTAVGFDVVLSDLAMPAMGGIDLLARLRAADPAASVLIFTGQATPDQMAAAAVSGAGAVLRKPFELAEVLAAIHGAYSERQRAGHAARAG